MSAVQQYSQMIYEITQSA